MLGIKKSQTKITRQPPEFENFLENFRRAYAKEEERPLPNKVDAQRILAEKAIHPYMKLDEVGKRMGSVRFKIPRL